mmetsp:Transcript_21957/g.24535  ORF Transcript_21957/g.24535 Transcript_21957/m.24535 type:complete len:392 (+) Transcript_21957:43-1218(+)
MGNIPVNAMPTAGISAEHEEGDAKAKPITPSKTGISTGSMSDEHVTTLERRLLRGESLRLADKLTTARRVARTKKPTLTLRRGSKNGVKKFKPSQIKRDQPFFALGTYGKLFTGKAHGIKEEVAIKDMARESSEAKVEEWRNEVNMMVAGENPYVVYIYGYCQDKQKLSIIMEYMDKGSLHDVLHVNKEKLSLLHKLRMARHCALGLAYLKSKHTLHRDIKSPNILVNSDGICKIADFGCAKLVAPTLQRRHTNDRGTYLWMAPEVRQGEYDYAADIYSLGIVFYELFEGKMPEWDKMKMKTVLPKKFPSDILVRRMIAPNPKTRPTAKKVSTLLDTYLRGVLKPLLPECAEREEDLEIQLESLFTAYLGLKPEALDALISKHAKDANNKA